MGSVKILSHNVRGLVDSKKRRQVFHKFNGSNYQIFLLQETHSDINSEKQWKAEWGAEIIFSHGTRDSRGTCILIKNSVSRTIHEIIKDDNGRYVIIDIEIDDTRLTLASVYGPNNDDPDFFIKFINDIESIQNDHRVIAGDWNLVLNLDVDKKGGAYTTNHKSQEVIKLWMEETDMIDIWRHSNPNDFQFTWKRLNPNPGIFCRLDFFLTSFGLVNQIEKCQILPGFKSDHSSPIIALSTLLNVRGKGFWKFNSSYIRDPDYVNLVKQTISDTVEINQEANPDLLWDTIKCQIRGASVKFCSRKKKSKDNILHVLENKLTKLESVISQNYTQEMEIRINETKEEIEKLIEDKTKGAILRSRAQWTEEGERPSKYFLNLEKRNSNNKTVSRLTLENGVVVSKTEEILEAQKQFYNKLYTSSIDADTRPAFDNFVRNLNVPQLSEIQKGGLEGPVTEQEILQALKATKNGKSPGTDGFPAEFYKFFWSDIKEYYMASIRYAYNNGNLSFTQRQGIISLIPKKDRSPLLLKNWRPISLLNTDYKLVAKAIATRIKKVLPDLISSDQTGFISGRYIGENIIRLLNIIDYVDEEDIPALLISIDYEKAFDCVEWSFIEQTLSLFNFGHDIKKWVQILYKDINSCVINNGWSSEFFTLERGVRQGCPLSPYLFVICVEIMAISIRDNPDIKGIEINGSTQKISQFADDTTFMLLFCNQSFQELFTTLNRFQHISGLKINYEKTEILRIGSLKYSNAQIYTQKPLKWTLGPLTILGIQLSLQEDFLNINYTPLLKKIQFLTNIWESRDLTWLGKVTIVKTLLVSQLIYRFAILPTPSDEVLKCIDTMFFDFIWSKGKHFVSKVVICGPISEGGLNMVDVYSKEISIKCNWVKMLISDTNANWKILANMLIPGEGNSFWEGNLNQKDIQMLLKRKSQIWSDICKSWSKFNFEEPTDIDTIIVQPLNFNSFIRINDKPFYSKLYSKGMKTIQDILDENGNFIDYDSFKNNFEIVNDCKMLYNSIVSAIPQNWKIVIRNYFYVRNPINTIPLKIEKVKRNSKPSKHIYSCLIQKKNTGIPNRLHEKWQNDLNTVIDNDFLSQAFELSFESSLFPKLKVFQYRVIHRNLVTNKDLMLWGIKQDNLCTFCNEEEETILHLLWECTFACRIWTQLFSWIYDNSEINIVFTPKDTLLGVENLDNNILYNTLFMIVKQYLYSCRCREILPNFNHLMKSIKEVILIEKYIAVKKNKLDIHNKKWALLY